MTRRIQMMNQSTNHFLNKWNEFLKENKNYIKPDDKEEILKDMASIFEKNLAEQQPKNDDVE